MNKKSTTQQRFAQIAKLGEVVFHSKDLANLWQIHSQNTLHTTLKRYKQRGLLIRIYRNLYSLKPVEDIEGMLLGLKAIHEYAYISTETVLADAGIIYQAQDKITLVSSKSRKFSIGPYLYYSRKMADKYLFNPIGVVDKNKIKIATIERAVADLLYFQPEYFFDAARLIKWQRVKKMQLAIGYPHTPKYYDSSSPQRSKT